MLDKIIEFLGGTTGQNYNLLNVEYISQRDLVNSYRAREEFLKSQLQEEREERVKLQNIIFNKFGIVVNDQTSSFEEAFQPINTSPRRWSGLKLAMEQDDRKRAKSNYPEVKDIA